MRIITGKARGLKLLTPKDYNVRPTADRVKESLFNIINNRLPGAKVLDAFAGTGNLGLEAWSRGAEQITFVDQSATSLKLVASNIAKCRAEKSCQMLRGNVITLLSRLGESGEQFDIIFSDPPYNHGWNAQLVEGLLHIPLLKPGGLLVLEYSNKETLPELPAEFTEIRTQKYGETFISLIIWK